MEYAKSMTWQQTTNYIVEILNVHILFYIYTASKPITILLRDHNLNRSLFELNMIKLSKLVQLPGI